MLAIKDKSMEFIGMCFITIVVVAFLLNRITFETESSKRKHCNYYIKVALVTHCLI